MKTKKPTFLQYFSRFPKPIRDKAIHNFKERQKEVGLNYRGLRITGQNALIEAFIFADTPEGVDYWWDVYKQIFRTNPVENIVEPTHLDRSRVGEGQED